MTPELAFLTDQVIREDPASRGTETSAEVLVGPPLGAGGWSETPVNSMAFLTYLLTDLHPLPPHLPYRPRGASRSSRFATAALEHQCEGLV